MRRSALLRRSSISYASLLVALILAMLVGGPTGIAGASASSPGSTLPDGRAWEMISPLEKNSGDIRGIDEVSSGGVVQAEAEGEKITYLSLASFGDPQGAPSGSQYVSERKAGGWETQNISTPMSAQAYGQGTGAPYKAFSPDLSMGLVFAGPLFPGSNAVETPPLTDSAPGGYENYYLRTVPAIAESASARLQPLLTRETLLAHAAGVSASAFRLEFLGATSDLSHIVVSSPAALGGGAIESAGRANLYEWTDSPEAFQPINILPDGTPYPQNGLLLGGFSVATGRAISEDGSRVIWTSRPPGKGLYVREGIGTSQARTVQADAPLGEGSFLTASSDGSKVFFADNERLTGNSTASSEGLGDLYEFEPEGKHLLDLTVDETDAGGAEVQGVLGASENGSYVYFVANGVLPGAVGAGAASLGHCELPVSPPGATCNLYLSHDGETRFVATLAGSDEYGLSGKNVLGVAFDWDRMVARRTARVSRDGTRVVFMSDLPLTGYDNIRSGGADCGEWGAVCEEVFLYEAGGDRLSCVSCNPSGARPVGPSGIPGGTEFYNRKALYQSRVLSEGGASSRVFFESGDALTPRDTNAASDVYEYEGGHVYLLSGGTSASGAAFVDASTSGDDVFFLTRAQLAGQDTDQLVDLYDARAPHVAGEAVGFPAPPPAVGCSGEDCRQSTPSPPLPGGFASAAFSGSGNSAPASTPIVKPKPLTGAQKLAKALKACHKKRGMRKRKRVACERQARKRYAAKSTATQGAGRRR
jgi:WD40 repeat protein